jgi:hypothetical protein
MVVHRPKLTKNFVQMANETVFDGRLTRLARQLLTEIMARPRAAAPRICPTS